jgi:predicted DNA-binding transcriptional regulator AlpA
MTSYATTSKRPWEALAPCLPLLRLPKVCEDTALPPSSIYDAIAAGEFPPPVKIGRRAVAWPKCHIDAWLASRVEAVAAPTRSAAASKESRPRGRGKARDRRARVV